MLVPGEITSSLTAYGRNALLDWTLGTMAFGAPANIWLALCARVPMDSDNGSTMPEIESSYLVDEVPVATGYERVTYPFGNASVVDSVPAWQPRGFGVYSTAREISFAPALSQWPTVMAWAMTDAPNEGNLLAYGSASLAVQQGDTVVLPAGALTISVLAMMS